MRFLFAIRSQGIMGDLMEQNLYIKDLPLSTWLCLEIRTQDEVTL